MKKLDVNDCGFAHLTLIHFNTLMLPMLSTSFNDNIIFLCFFCMHISKENSCRTMLLLFVVELLKLVI